MTEISTATINEQQERSVTDSGKASHIKAITGAAIFIAISLIVSATTTEYIPRVAWGLAYFDPISIIWITALLIYGYKAGFMTLLGGTIGLMLFDPNPLEGPIFKFSATLAFFVVPYVISKMTGDDSLASLKENFLKSGIIATLIRVVLMVVMNYLYMVYYYHSGIEWVSLAEIGGDPGVSGLMALTIIVVLMNLIGSVFDVLVPRAIINLKQIQTLVEE